MTSTSERSLLAPDAAPAWLTPLVGNAGQVKQAYRRRVPAALLAMVTAANAKTAVTGAGRDAAVLVLFSGPRHSPTGGLPDDADLLVTVHDQMAEDDRVATRWSATGTHAGDFAGVPATGRLVTVSGIHIHRVRHGRLVEHWEELNLLGLLRQLGVLS